MNLNNSTPHTQEVIRILRQLQHVEQPQLENLILATPTGDARNLLTEANIFLMLTTEKLQEAAALVTRPVPKGEPL